MHKYSIALLIYSSFILPSDFSRIVNHAPDSYGLTPLHKAAIKKKGIFLLQLLEDKGDPFVQDKEGFTVLHRALQYHNNSKVIKRLINSAPQASDKRITHPLNLRTLRGYTALMFAVLRSKSKTIKILIEDSRVDKSIKNKNGELASQIALRELKVATNALTEAENSRKSEAEQKELRKKVNHFKRVNLLFNTSRLPRYHAPKNQNKVR